MTRRRGARQRISAIVACYRDAPAVPFMYDRLKAVFEKIAVAGEIIFVNDGSPDDAAAVLLEACRAALTSRGILLLFHHNVDALSARLLGERSAIVDN